MISSQEDNAVKDGRYICLPSQIHLITMFAVQKTSIARSTVVCSAQKPVQAKVRPR